MGGASIAAGECILARAGIPTFTYLDTAVRIFCRVWRYTCNLRSLCEMAALGSESSPEAEAR
jgi:acetyltransferase